MCIDNITQIVKVYLSLAIEGHLLAKGSKIVFKAFYALRGCLYALAPKNAFCGLLRPLFHLLQQQLIQALAKSTKPLTGDFAALWRLLHCCLSFSSVIVLKYFIQQLKGCLA